MKHLMRTATAALLVTFGVAACGSSSSSKSTSAPATTASAATTTAAAATTAAVATTGGSSAAGGDSVTIKDFAFQVPASVKAGSTLTIKNEDGSNHTFTDKAGAFSVPVSAGGTATVTVDKPGTYDIICEIHARMKGTLVVT